MEIDTVWLALGIAAFGYFIGDGMKNFKNPMAKNALDDEHELLKESEVHLFMGISKEDATKLVEEHTDVPHMVLNGKTYFPKAKLREWLMKEEN